jgi:hypothetical protein
MKNNRFFAAAASAGCYALSFTQPIFACPFGGAMDGFHVLTIGWLGPITLQPAWYANIAYFMMIARVVRGKIGHNLIMPIIGSVLALGGLFGAMTCGPGTGNWSDGLAVGGYLWVAAILIISASYALNRPARAC